MNYKILDLQVLGDKYRIFVQFLTMSVQTKVVKLLK